MTTTDLVEVEKGKEQFRACFVIDHKSLENIQNIFIDTNVLITYRESLLDLLKDTNCNLYVVDTSIKDIDSWPAPLLTIPNAKSKDWLFLISRLSDASRLQPLPENSKFIDGKRFSVEDVASLVKKQLDPESRKRFAKVKYMENVGAFLIWMESGKTYALNISELSEADSTKVAKWTLSKERDCIKVIQLSGNKFEIPWDDVLYHCEPQYEFYKGKRSQNEDTGLKRIGEKVRQLRKRKGYSIQTLADKSKMKRPNLSRIENGHHQPSLDTLERIAVALEVPVVELIAK
jgi:DNA-binding XRE family transcriptional regulator